MSLVQQQKLQFAFYQERLKALMELTSVIQYNMQNDEALKFMRNQEMAKYRIDRGIQVIKDVLLNQKQRMLIRALTKCQQLQFKIKQQQQQQMQYQNQYQKQKWKKADQLNNKLKSHNLNSLNNNQQVVQRDGAVSSSSIQSMKMSGVLVSAKNGNPSTYEKSGNINIYEKLLQDKIVQIKQYQKKESSLKQQINNMKKMVNEVQMSNKKLKTQIEQNKVEKMSLNQVQVCQKCEFAQSQINYQKQKFLKINLQLKNAQNRQIQLSTIIKQSNHQIKQLQLKLKTAQQQLVLNHNSYQQSLHKSTRQHQLSTINKQEYQSMKNTIIALQQQIQKQAQNKPHTNLKLIANLRNQVCQLQEELISIQNNFNQIRQHFANKLQSQIKKNKRFYETSKQYIKSSLILMKQQMQRAFVETISLIQVKYKSVKARQQMVKKINQMDNQLDYFIQNHLATQ